MIADALHELRQSKSLADRAIASLDDAAFFHRPAELVNPVALIVKHVAGNLASRWTDLFTTDGEKPDRDRDAEFVLLEGDTRAGLLAAWDRGWAILFDTLGRLSEAELERTITIRGEPFTVAQALLRGMNHAAYHTGQIAYLARMLNPTGAWLTIAPGESAAARGTYRQPL